MAILKNRILAALVFAIIVLLSMILPQFVTLISIISAALIASVHYIRHNYDINYKYWFSFVGQLCALVFIVLSFVLVFILTTSLIIH